MSPALQQIIGEGLFERLPRTFSAFFYEQFKDWNLLFPAEHGYYERLFALLDRSEPDAVARLFESLQTIEHRMGVDLDSWPSGRFSLEQVDFLHRSPHYGQWRSAIAAIFSKIDPLLEAEVARAGRPRLVVIVTPQEIPAGPDRMWLRIAGHGRRVRLGAPPSPAPLLAKIAHAYAGTRSSSPYDTWIIDAAGGMPPVRSDRIVTLNYTALEPYRDKLMAEVSRIVEKEQIRGPRQLGARLKQLQLANHADPVLAEFTRAVLLNGNGTLLINNTFVEWAAVQAARRARPSLSIIAFGIRNKMKPFSSLLIYTDQGKSNPIPAQMDTLGSYVDLEVFYQYIWQEFEKYAEYRRNTAYLFFAEGADEMLIIAPRDFPAGPESKLESLLESAGSWVGV